MNWTICLDYLIKKLSFLGRKEEVVSDIEKIVIQADVESQKIRNNQKIY